MPVDDCGGFEGFESLTDRCNLWLRENEENVSIVNLQSLLMYNNSLPGG